VTALIDRKFGCFYPSTTVANGSYVYNFDYLEGAVTGRQFDVFSTFLDLQSDYPGNPTPPSTRKKHDEITTAMQNGRDVLGALSTVYTYVQCTDGGYYPVYAAGVDIQAGTFDARITAEFNWLLGAAAAYGRTVIVRFMWESNLGPNVSQFYPGTTGYAATGTPTPPTSSPMKVLTSNGASPITTPADYIATWRYVTNLLRGLTNGSRVKTFYCPGSNDGSAAQAAGNTLSAMFPGTAYVDYVGYDTYNNIGTGWNTPLATLRGPRPSDASNPFAYDILTALHSTADVWIGEINCMDQNDPLDTSHSALGHSKAQWYTDLFAIADDLPKLTTICFFNQPGTRKTWPFNSSADALAAFQQGFNFGTGTTQHGVAAAPYVTPGNVPAVNPSGINLPLPTGYLPGQAGHSAGHNALSYWINQIAALDGSGFAALKANSDGTIAAVTITRQGDGTSYVPAIDIKSSSGTVHNVAQVRLGTNQYNTFEWREDGRFAWGPGDSGNPDILLSRSAAGTLTITSTGSTPGNLIVSGYLAANNLALPNVTSTPAAPAAGGGVQLFAQSDVLKVRNQSLTYTLRPSPLEKFTSIVPYTPEAASTTSAALTAGIVYLVRLYVHDARTLSRVGFNIVAGATTPTTGQCLAGIYDAAGNLIGSSADQSAVWTSTGSKNMTVTAVTSLAVEPAYFYAGILFNGTTGPTVSRSAGLGTFLQTGGSGTNYGRYGTAQTALPTTLTLASITTDTDNKFFTVS
jgi:hypothetical protein